MAGSFVSRPAAVCNGLVHCFLLLTQRSEIAEVFMRTSACGVNLKAGIRLPLQYGYTVNDVETCVP